MKKQEVVRSYPRGYTNPADKLKELLQNGYRVVMCNPISIDGKEIILEYIVEKDIE